MADMDTNEVGKAVLQPRRPGESIKVAEVVLKRRDRNLKAAAARAATIAKGRAAAKDLKAHGKLRVVRAEKLVKQCVTRQADRRRLKNKGKKPLGQLQRGQVLVVVRNGREAGSKEVKKVLKELKLWNRHSAVFLPNTAETGEHLKTCRPFLFWGSPSFKAVSNLVHKRALFRDPADPSKKVPLSDNTLIEEHLGDLGVLCTEDLAHSLFTCSEHFGQVTERLWPIPLGDVKRATKMAREQKEVFGDLRDGVDDKLYQLLGQ